MSALGQKQTSPPSFEIQRGKFNECVANTSMFWASHALVGAVLPLEKSAVFTGNRGLSASAGLSKGQRGKRSPE
jgi:hypothetical protein